jgi:hypothetical protein
MGHVASIANARRSLSRFKHTRQFSDSESERVRPAFIEAFVRRTLNPWLRAHGFDRGYSISLTVDRLPADRAGRRDLSAAILTAVELAMQASPPSLGGADLAVRFDRDDHRDMYEPIMPYVRELEVLRHHDKGQPTTIGSSASGREELTAAPDQRVLWSFLDKERRLGPSASDLVLLIEFDVIPYDPALDVPCAQEQFREQRCEFHEVWIVSEWLNPAPRADRVWPILETTTRVEIERQ